MKTTVPWTFLPHGWRLAAAALSLTLVCGCEALGPMRDAASGLLLARRRARHRDASASAPRAAATAPTLIVNPPHAAAGFDSQRIMYVRQAHKLEYFAHSEWVDTPARMLAPLIVAAVESQRRISRRGADAEPAAGDMRLDTEIVRPATRVSERTEPRAFHAARLSRGERDAPVIASREFDAAVPAASEDPYGGVVAAKRGQTVLEDLAAAAPGSAPLRTEVTELHQFFNGDDRK